MSIVAPVEDSLLGPVDPAPVELLRAQGGARFVLSCEHAGQAVPARLGDLGLPPGEIDRHIGWDIGAEGVARALSVALDAPLVLQRYSRLVIDCNRPAQAPDCIPETSDGTHVPANRGLCDADRAQRWREIHAPFHAALAGLLDARGAAGQPAALLSVHSFTPRLACGGDDRPWHVGLLARRDARFAPALMAALRRRDPGLVVALDVPYRIEDRSDYTIPVHGEARAIPHVLLEIRQDLIATARSQARWGALLAAALRDVSASLADGSA